jgi:SsrA-binding protein
MARALARIAAASGSSLLSMAWPAKSRSPVVPFAFGRGQPKCATPMARPKPSTFDKTKIVAENRRARFDYFIEETFEAGIALSGTEVKSLRFGEGSITESYAEVQGNECWLINANIPEFSHGNRFNHEPKRPRKLLLHAREIEKFVGAVERKGMTLVPLSVYFNARGRAKVELALAKGKQTHDKRQSIKERDWKRDKARLLRERG